MLKPIMYNDPKFEPKKNSNGLYDYVVHDEERIYGFFGKYFFLCNGYKTPIQDLEFGNIIYQYSENAYQAQKFGDINIKKLFTSIHFIDAIKLAYDLRFKIKNDFQDQKLGIMEQILTQKFNNANLRQRLLDTAQKELREDNHWNDYEFGFCNGWGHNHLGKILMKIRNN